MSDQAALRALLRLDLKDPTGSGERWADAVLNRHLDRALEEYSQVSPVEANKTLTATPGSRNIALSALDAGYPDNFVRILAVEWPTGEYPRQFVPFSIWADVLTLDVTNAPAAADNVAVLWFKTHDYTTAPDSHDDIIVTGAAGYAALEYAAYVANRVNIGADNTWGEFIDFANERLEQFRGKLRQLPRANIIRRSILYAPVSNRFATQTTDPGPQ
jgi:hypothetical protein